MNGLCHCSEPTLRSPQLIMMDDLSREETCGACWEAFHLAHSPLWRPSKKKGAEGTSWHSGQQCQGQRLDFALMSVDSTM